MLWFLQKMGSEARNRSVCTQWQLEKVWKVRCGNGEASVNKHASRLFPPKKDSQEQMMAS